MDECGAETRGVTWRAETIRPVSIINRNVDGLNGS